MKYFTSTFKNRLRYKIQCLGPDRDEFSIVRSDECESTLGSNGKAIDCKSIDCWFKSNPKLHSKLNYTHHYD